MGYHCPFWNMMTDILKQTCYCYWSCVCYHLIKSINVTIHNYTIAMLSGFCEIDNILLFNVDHQTRWHQTKPLSIIYIDYEGVSCDITQSDLWCWLLPAISMINWPFWWGETSHHEPYWRWYTQKKLLTYSRKYLF